MIETPSSTALKIDSSASKEHDDEYLDTPESPLLYPLEKKLMEESPPAVEPELLIIKQKPITAKIRTTMRHLRAQAGPWSRFRGLFLAIVYHQLHHVLFRLLTRLSVGPLTKAIAYIVTSVALCGLDMTWTHIVISVPSAKPWWRRIPSANRVKLIIVPAAIRAIAEQAVIQVPVVLFTSLGLMKYLQDDALFQNATFEVQKAVLKKFSLVAFLSLLIGFLVVIPATVSLRRVQASMLPEEDESIVPFDRTFNGKVQAGETGSALSMLEAWKTFDWTSRIRYLKLQAKIGVLTLTSSIMFVMLIIGELKVFGVMEKASVMFSGVGIGAGMRGEN